MFTQHAFASFVNVAVPHGQFWQTRAEVSSPLRYLKPSAFNKYFPFVGTLIHHAIGWGQQGAPTNIISLLTCGKPLAIKISKLAGFYMGTRHPLLSTSMCFCFCLLMLGSAHIFLQGQLGAPVNILVASFIFGYFSPLFFAHFMYLDVDSRGHTSRYTTIMDSV